MLLNQIGIVISCLALFAAVIFIIQNVIKRKENASRVLFAYFLSAFGFIISFFLLIDLGYQNVLLPVLPFLLGALLIVSPLLWVYINNVTGNKILKGYAHFIISISAVVITGILLVLNTLTEGQNVHVYIQNILLYFVLGVMSVVFITQSVIYIIKMFFLYKNHKKNIEQVFSYSEKINLSWLRYLIWGYAIFIIGLVIVHIVEDYYSGFLFSLLLLSYICFTGYQGYVQKPVFTAKAPLLDTSKDNGDYSNSEHGNLSGKEELFLNLKKSIIHLMEIEKKYTNDSLNIHDLANQLNTNGKYISQVVNSNFNKSFVVFVNEYRIEEAKRLLDSGESKNFTIESIGYQSGFKSKSAFNSSFKKFTGMTPTQYLSDTSKR